MLKFVAPLLVFGIVVFVHELGHFLAAKLTGVYAPVFAFGWGPRLIGFKWGETDYRWSWFPIGGFVAMATKDSEAMSAIEGQTDLGSASGDGTTDGEGEADGGVPGHQRGYNPIPFDAQALRPFGPVPVPSSRWIESKSLPAKVFILSAGVLMNVVLALGVTTATFMSFGRSYVPAVVDSVVAGRPAAAAGLAVGDSIVAISGTPIQRWTQVLDKVTASPGERLDVEVVRAGGAHTTLQITPSLSDDVDQITGAPVKVGRIGAAPRATLAKQSVGFGEAVASGWDTTWRMATGGVTACRLLDVGERDRALRAGPREIGDVDAELGRAPASCGRRAPTEARHHGGLGRSRLDLADDGAGVGLRGIGECYQRRSGLDDVADRRVQPGDEPGIGGRDLDHGLVGLDRDQRLVGDDVIALADMPGDDLGFLEALAQIRQVEDAHR